MKKSCLNSNAIAVIAPVWRNKWKPLSLPKFLLYWIQVQGRSSWQRFIVHIKYSQHNVHTIVQVHFYTAEFPVQIPNQKCSFRSSCKCYLFWYQPIRVKLVFTVTNVPHCYWMQYALGMFGSPIDECNMLQTSLGALDMFDLCLVINCKICLDLDYCLAD